MNREELRIEYPFGNASEQVLWRMIGDPLGLAVWFSEGITVEDDIYTFIWESSEQVARMLKVEENSFIRFQWEEDEGSDYYFQFELINNVLNKEITFVVTDFIEKDEQEDAILLWNKQVGDLKRKCGI